MGYCLVAYSVDLGEIQQVIGSRDSDLLEDLVEQFGEELESYDEMVADGWDEESEEEPLTMASALRQMVMGEEYRSDVGFIYGYALELLARYFGDMLPNRHWSAMPRPTEWIETVDAALEKGGVEESVFRVGRMTRRGAPIPLPTIDDWPSIGFLKLAEMPVIRTALKHWNHRAVDETSIVKSLDELQSWLQTCAETRRDLITFLA